jgi:lactate permease
MQAGLSLLPLLLVIALIAARKVTLAVAGLVALATSLPAVLYLRGTDGLDGFLWLESLKGAWIAWQGLSVIMAGVLLYQVMRRRPSARAAREAGIDPHRGAFAACFLFGVFVETAVGFGVGTIIAAVGLLRLGLGGPAAAALTVFSQILVPWGAMAVGTGIGAGLLGVEVGALGASTAEVTAFTLPFLMPFFWLLLRRAGVALQARNLALDMALIAALCGLLVAVNRYVAVELGGIIAPGALAVAVTLPRLLRDPEGGRALIRDVWPYLLLAISLLATRLLPGIPELLHAALDLRPFDGMPAFPVLYHASFWLLVTAVIAAPRNVWRRELGAVLRDGWNMARTPLLVTLFFVVQAQWMLASGGAAALGAGWQSVAGDLSVLAAPLFSASVAGPSGSNTAAIAMMMPVMQPIALTTGVPVLLVAAAQNIAGGISTMLSPGRIALATNLLGIQGAESNVYREMLPVTVAILFAPILVLGVLAWWV